MSAQALSVTAVGVGCSAWFGLLVVVAAVQFVIWLLVTKSIRNARRGKRQPNHPKP